MESEFLIMGLQFCIVGMAVLVSLFYASLAVLLGIWWIVEFTRISLVSLNRHFSGQLDNTAHVFNHTIKSKASKKGFVQ